MDHYNSEVGRAVDAIYLNIALNRCENDSSYPFHPERLLILRAIKEKEGITNAVVSSNYSSLVVRLFSPA